MSRSKPISDHHDADQSENRKRPKSSHSMAIACRVCDRVFFDNISLILHFECHLKNEDIIPEQLGRNLASLRADRHLSLSLSPFSSSVEKKTEACHAASPGMNDCFRPCPLVSSVITPNVAPKNVIPVQKPVLNPMAPINASFDARWNLSQPIHRSIMSHYRPTSSLTPSLMYSQLGASSLAYDSASVPPLQIREQNAGQGCFSDYKNPRMKQFEKPVPEIIIISDDEEDDNKSAPEIDLTLKL